MAKAPRTKLMRRITRRWQGQGTLDPDQEPDDDVFRAWEQMSRDGDATGLMELGILAEPPVVKDV